MKREIRRERSFLGGSHTKTNLSSIDKICELKSGKMQFSHNFLPLIFWILNLKDKFVFYHFFFNFYLSIFLLYFYSSKQCRISTPLLFYFSLHYFSLSYFFEHPNILECEKNIYSYQLYYVENNWANIGLLHTFAQKSMNCYSPLPFYLRKV
jgi:hypothetical protein